MKLFQLGKEKSLKLVFTDSLMDVTNTVTNVSAHVQVTVMKMW